MRSGNAPASAKAIRAALVTVKVDGLFYTVLEHEGMHTSNCCGQIRFVGFRVSERARRETLETQCLAGLLSAQREGRKNIDLRWSGAGCDVSTGP